MALLDQLNVGIVGVARRGKFALHLPPGMRLHALCDTNAEALDRVSQAQPPCERWSDFNRMIERSDLDAVIIATPMPLHVPQAITALAHNLHVLSEVPAGVSLEQCRDLVRACRQSTGSYMLAENMNYYRPIQIVTGMVRAGLFGSTYYAEGEYLHPIRPLFASTPWRRQWQAGVDGITYGTHSLGPILQWMPGDRVTSVCCAGGGRHHRDEEGRLYENQQPCVMLCRMQSGGLVKIRVDLIADRPHCHKFHLQGVDGCFEATAIDDGTERVWLRSRCAPDQWRQLDAFADEFLPPLWRQAHEQASSAGHGGSDYVQLLDWVTAIRTGQRSPIDIDQAMDMTLPGLISQQSIAQGGRWLEVPDSRSW